MSLSHLELASLIGSRICHDLISPIGAINNGLELLGMAGATSGPEMNLLTESVESASARIRYFRLAFGVAGQQEVSNTEISRVLDDVTRNTKIQIDWAVEHAAPRTEVRLALLAQQCVESAMPYGGEIVISRDASGWCIRGLSDKFNIDEPVWNILAGSKIGQDLAPSQVQFALLAVHCRDDKRRLQAELADHEITVRF